MRLGVGGVVGGFALLLVGCGGGEPAGFGSGGSGFVPGEDDEVCSNCPAGAIRMGRLPSGHFASRPYLHQNVALPR